MTKWIPTLFSVPATRFGFRLNRTTPVTCISFSRAPAKRGICCSRTRRRNEGSNRIQRNREYELPAGGRFTFDEQAGAERMFIVLSRRAEPDLEKLIYSLSQGGDTKPASVDKSDDKSQMMLAQKHMTTTVIERICAATFWRETWSLRKSMTTRRFPPRAARGKKKLCTSRRRIARRMPGL